MTTTLTDQQLCEIIGKTPGNDDKNHWTSSDLPGVNIALRALKASTSEESFLIGSTLPQWLYLGITASLAPRRVAITTPNFGPVSIPSNTPKGSGSGLTFRTCEDAQFTLVQFSSPRDLPLDQLTEIIPPVVNPDKGVVVYAKAPPWIVVTVGLAYAHAASWVACTQKHGHPVVAFSVDKTMIVGTELKREHVARIAEMAAKNTVPKRGEVWLFDDGYGEHPGIILSTEDRNSSCNDLLLVPLTTSTRQAFRHLYVRKEETGLAYDCFAQCSNISRIGKQRLLRGPISIVTHALIDDVITNVRRAMGDAA